MIRKILILPLIALIIMPFNSVLASTLLTDPTSEVIDNISEIKSVDFNTDFYFETNSEKMDNPFSLHTDFDGVIDEQGNGSFDFALQVTDYDSQFKDFYGSMIVTHDKIYFSQAGDDWFFIKMNDGQISLFSENEENDLDQIKTLITEMLKNGVIEYHAETVDYISGKLAVRYYYEINCEKLADYLIEQRQISNADAIKLKSLQEQNLKISGNFWIDTVEMMPVMFTLDVVSDPVGVAYTKFGFSVLLNSINKVTNIRVPESALSFENYDSHQTEDFVMSSIDSIESNLDTDGDGLTNQDETNIWKTDIFSADTDGDGYKDGTEVINGYNPNGKGKLDSDGDGLSDYNEMTIHWTNRFDTDSDNDGYNDGLEVAYGYDPNGPGRW